MRLHIPRVAAVALLAAPIAISAQQPRTSARARAAARDPKPATSHWDATILYDSLTIPFPLDLETRGNDVTVTLYNGADPISSTSGTKQGDSIIVAFAHLASELRGRVDGNTLSATFGPTTGRGLHAIEAHPHVESPVITANVPDIGGTWIIPAKSSKGEGAWRFVVQQKGATATATILRVDGDAGAHVGQWNGDRFVLNHFDGTRPSQIEVVPTPDGGLDVITNSARGHGKPVHALRPSVALAQGIPAPADFMAHTRVKNPDEPFRFSFPDINGQLVSNTDGRFTNKVIVVEIGGTWCPNCHDEAPFLSELYKRYHDRGLEVVGLDFEDSTQLKSLDRPRAFVKKYGIAYPFLIAGLTAERDAKITQAEGLDSWPTTFFIGRDGKVRAVHAGFAAAASGDFHAQLIAEYDETIEKLLAEPTVAASAVRRDP